MDQKLSNSCPCCSGALYENCCRPFHEGAKPATALELMRSRYTAFALDKPDYIMETTHPKNPHFSSDKLSWKQSISQFSKSSNFNRLVILSFEEKLNLATVIFTAYIIQDDRDCSFTEKSYFEKIGNRWLYLDGEINEGTKPPTS